MEFDHVDASMGEPPGEHPRHFQGDARLQSLPNPFPDRTSVFAVHFEAGGRTRPHAHRSGQMLVITEGHGLVGDASGRRLVGPGDVVVAGPGEWHWHGATPTSPMTHVTVQLASDTTDWGVEERDWADDYGA